MPGRRLAVSLRTTALALALAAPACGGEASGVVDVSVTVARVAFDPLSNTPVVVLEESEGPRRLLIWIGPAEARSIAQRLERIDLPRPNTHDLAQRLVEGLQGDVERVTVTELRDGTYYAVIALRRDGRRVEIDARPSDAIALALRTAAPLFVREGLLEPAAPDPEAPVIRPAPDEPKRRT
jgi:bifunctional DNase/RNase